MKKVTMFLQFKFYHYLISILGLVKVFPTILTEKSNLVTLIQKLHPISSGIELIRIGTKGDGGYLVPNDLEGIDACFSPGVEYKSDFEKECADLGMKVFLADLSVDGPAFNDVRFIFTKKFIGATTSESFMTVNNWVNSSLPNSKTDLLLQIDIEGYEYETFLSMSDELMQRFRIIVVEFHHLEKLWSRPFFRLAFPTFEKILQTHSCVHIHPNNCERPLNYKGLTIPGTMEFTFLRNDRFKNRSYANHFPHPLDFHNSNSAKFSLPKCWYKNL